MYLQAVICVLYYCLCQLICRADTSDWPAGVAGRWSQLTLTRCGSAPIVTRCVTTAARRTHPDRWTSPSTAALSTSCSLKPPPRTPSWPVSPVQHLVSRIIQPLKANNVSVCGLAHPQLFIGHFCSVNLLHRTSNWCLPIHLSLTY